MRASNLVSKLFQGEANKDTVHCDRFHLPGALFVANEISYYFSVLILRAPMPVLVACLIPALLFLMIEFLIYFLLYTG